MQSQNFLEKVMTGSLLKEQKDGEFLFYPWGHPGDAFIITHQKKKVLLTLSLLLLSIILSASFTAFLLLSDYLVLRDFRTVSAIIGIFFSVVYWFFLQNLKKSSALHKETHAKSGKKNSILIVALLISLQPLYMLIFHNSMYSTFLLAFLLVYELALFYISMKIWLSNGFYFSSQKERRLAGT